MAYFDRWAPYYRDRGSVWAVACCARNYQKVWQTKSENLVTASRKGVLGDSDGIVWLMSSAGPGYGVWERWCAINYQKMVYLKSRGCYFCRRTYVILRSSALRTSRILGSLRPIDRRQPLHSAIHSKSCENINLMPISCFLSTTKFSVKIKGNHGGFTTVYVIRWGG